VGHAVAQTFQKKLPGNKDFWREDDLRPSDKSLSGVTEKSIDSTPTSTAQGT
jgi:hypothetical protein